MTRNILIDIDNTLTHIETTLRTFESYFGLNEIMTESMFSFDFGAVYGLSDKEHRSFWDNKEGEIVSNSSLNEAIYQNIRNTVEDNDRIFIVTARDIKFEEATRQWLAENNVIYDELYCIGKGENKLEWSKRMGLTFDVVYEDNTEYLELLSKENDTYVIAVDYPYNRHIQVDERLRPDGVLVEN